MKGLINRIQNKVKFYSTRNLSGIYSVVVTKTKVNPIPTDNGLNQPIYSYHMTQAGRNRVKGAMMSINFAAASVFS